MKMRVQMEFYMDFLSVATLKVSSKIVADDILNVLFYFFSAIIRLVISCEFSARQTIHVKYQNLFSVKKLEKNIYIQECPLLQL